MAKKKKRKKRQPETPMERFKAQPLWFWGLTSISAALVSNVANQYMIEARGLRGAEAQGAKFGAAAVTLLFIIVGIVLIIMHFVKRK